ncbi:MAG: hypothetical protein JWN95_517 [Frankiales bacterium]|nr:hypothetical protein [Frankiales bacterium]
MTSTDTTSTDGDSDGLVEFLAARDLLFEQRRNQDAAYAEFRWPRPEHFNWALDYFDGVLAVQRGEQVGLRLVEDDGSAASYSFGHLSERSTQLAGWLAALGVERGTRVLLVLGNQVELWESMLACIKLGAVIIPATTLLSAADLEDRLERGRVGAVIVRSELTAGFAAPKGEFTPDYVPISVGEPIPGWLDYASSREHTTGFSPDAPTAGSDPLLLYFTSGTTAQPKLVEHTHLSYPVGHLSTMYWIGLQPGDIHLNVSSPGWAKHAWSCFFAPWNAGATVLLFNYARFDAARMLDVLVAEQVSTFCAPPTVWRMLVQQDLGQWRTSLRELVGAGEPLNPEVIAQVRQSWGITVRDGFGQTETTCQIGNPPGEPVKAGSMGRPLPGYRVVLADPLTGDHPVTEGEICLDLGAELSERPVGLMVGYSDDSERNDTAMAGGLYHTGDVASVDEDGYLTYIGRTDDVFKSSDYRISPFELESVLIEHPAVAEAAVVPAPDALRLSVPKAFVVLANGYPPDAATAADILGFCRSRLAPYKRIRRIEFSELPKTISGKIRRVELRTAEFERGDARSAGEFREDELIS